MPHFILLVTLRNICNWTSMQSETSIFWFLISNFVCILSSRICRRSMPYQVLINCIEREQLTNCDMGGTAILKKWTTETAQMQHHVCLKKILGYIQFSDCSHIF
jgi:hypothetical protein